MKRFMVFLLVFIILVPVVSFAAEAYSFPIFDKFIEIVRPKIIILEPDPFVFSQTETSNSLETYVECFPINGVMYSVFFTFSDIHSYSIYISPSSYGYLKKDLIMESFILSLIGQYNNVETFAIMEYLNATLSRAKDGYSKGNESSLARNGYEFELYVSEYGLIKLSASPIL